mmetsp:Transcript_11814/g.15687  ORF Transcript_11814/g.15687 Transcript_11814/m.15687 type:complete len:124 (+) Transcript_11814:310-681(+)
MEKFGCNRMIFSSSATVYGDPETLPLTESADLRPLNPYGRTKAMIEQILEDACLANKKLAVSALRYFNPVGAHPSGNIGEDPAGTPNNLMPYLSQVFFLSSFSYSSFFSLFYLFLFPPFFLFS